MNKSLRLVVSLSAAVVLIALVALSSGAAQFAHAQDATMAATGDAGMASTMAATKAELGATPTAIPLSGDPVLIGIAVAQTSDTSLLGQDQVLGAQVAEAFFNQRGGINGRPIKLVYEDAAGDPDSAINAFNKLISANVVAIVGPTLSTQALAADPVADKAGVPVLAPSNTAAGIPAIGQFVTRISAGVASYAANAIAVAKDADPNLKTVAVMFAQDDVFSTSETKVFQAGAKSLGLDVATVQTFSVKDKDFTSQISTVLGVNPQLIIISGLAVDGGNLVKQLRDLGYKGQIIGGNGLNTVNIFPVCQASCDGVLIAQAYGPGFDSPINNEFVQAYTLSQKQSQPSQLTGQLFSSVQVTVEALRALDKKSAIKDMDIASLRKALNDQIQSGTYETPLGAISFFKVKNKAGDTAGAELNQKQFYVAQIKMNDDGKTGTFNIVKQFEAKPQQ